MSEDDAYHGPVTLVSGEETVPAVTARLRGTFEPIDGRYHWYGRLESDAGVDRLAGGGRRRVTLSTEHGSADATLSDRDPWGRYRVSGVGTPPYPAKAAL